MARHRNLQWTCPDEADHSAAHVTHQILLDIRDELQELNRLFRCQNFLRIPQKLDAIIRNTAKPKRKPKLKLVKRRAA